MLPEWAALEFQGELKKWKRVKRGEDDAIAKDAADLRLFASSFVAGLKFGLFEVDKKVRHRGDWDAALFVPPEPPQGETEREREREREKAGGRRVACARVHALVATCGGEPVAVPSVGGIRLADSVAKNAPASHPFQFTDQKDETKATVIIGHHKLEGEKVTLSKPLAVLKKRREGTGDGPDGEGRVKYDVEGVIRWKFIFKERPRLLISKGK